MGDFFVHNVQFYDYKPVAINALAYDDDTEQLAVGFKNGSISIYNVRQDFYQTQHVLPNLLTSVEGLCWLERRLFSCGMTGFVSEVEPRMGTLKRQVATYAMGAWCMASNKTGARLAVGTEAGAVSLFKIDETSDELEFVESLQRAPSRILSISWSAFDANLIATAGVGFIALVDLRHGLAQKEFPTKPETAVVWDIAFLTADILASADSTGHVVLWSLASGGAVQRFSAHRSHVLCLAVHGSSLFAAGVDAVVRRYDRCGASGEWFEATLYRRHTHDVRALAVTPQGLVSGGEEGRLHVFPLHREAAGVQDGRHGVWTLPFAQPRHPHRVAMSRATKTEHGAFQPPLCVLQYTDRLELFRLGAATSALNHRKRQRRRMEALALSGAALPLSAPHRRLLVVAAKKDESIACCAVADSGKFLAYSTTSALRAFAVKSDMEAEQQEVLCLSRLAFGPRKPPACRLMAFARASSLLVTVQATDGLVVIWDCASGAMHRRFAPANESYASPCAHLLTCSEALMALGCLDGHVYVYSVATGVRLAQLPLRRDATGKGSRLPLLPIAVALSPGQRCVLALYTDHKFLEVELPGEAAKGSDERVLGGNWFSRFNRKAPRSWAGLPHFDWLSYIDRHRVLVANARHLVVLDTDQSVKGLRRATMNDEASERRKRSRREMEEEAKEEEEEVEELACMRSTTQFNFMLHVEVLSNAELAVVSLRPDNYALSLPPALHRKQFGV